MNSVVLPAVLNVLALIGCALALWLGQDNHKAPQSFKKSSPVASGLNQNPLFRLIDRIPLIRRSGRATVNDLAKAMFITLLISFVPSALSMPLPLVLWSSGFLLTIVALVLIMHPALSGRQSFKDNLRGRSPFSQDKK